MQYFGSNKVEGVAEDWMEIKMSWLQVHRAWWRWTELGGGGSTV